ncbi:MafI family immunity protein, partial [Hymenobacter coalescens]
MKQREVLTRALLAEATKLGLPQLDVEHATEMLEYAEYGLCFDIIAQQLYEFDVQTTEEFFQLTEQTATCLGIPQEEYV